MSLSWLRSWDRRFFPAPRRPVRRPRFVRPTLAPLENRVLLSVSLNLEVPSSSSYGATNSAVIQYSNTGTTAVAAPVLVLSADNADLWLPTDPDAPGSSLQVLATNPDPNGPAGTLAPGASGSIVVDFTSTTSTDGTPINFSLGQMTSGQTIDWSSLESSMRPSYINSTAWNAIFANFTANVGSTTDSYQAALDADATYLAQLGDPTNDVAGLVAYEISKADNDFGTAPLGGAVDISVPSPGPDLSFARAFQSTIAGRNQAGLFGLGWTSSWDISASTDSQGNVTIDEGGGLRYFALQRDGSYLPTLGDTGTLSAVFGGGYQLIEMDGSITAFNANGTLNYVQDSNDNRITAGYNASGQMVSLTESDGDALTIAYNSQGFISQITDPSGETADYTYDDAGHLLSVTTPQGTTNYSYVIGTGTPADNALQTILNPDGTQVNYTYDSEGWLSSSFEGTVANPIEQVTVSYLSPGGVTYTDANGAKTTVLYTDPGQAAVITDPLGNTTKLSYDASGDLTSAVLPGGTTYSYTYDLQGDLLSQTDALGNTTTFTYDTQGNLTSYTDAKGNTTSYAYDNNDDDLLSVTYANGNQQSYTYNPLGEATQFVDARGQAIGYSYNAQGQLIKETFADGTSYSYTYDANGNLTSAIDAQGNVTKFVYGGDANNPNNPDLLTEVEYPDGTYLKFSYSAGGRRTRSVDQTGFTVNYTYDAAGNLAELTDGNGNVIVQYTYDPAGNLIQQDNGNGTRTVYTYDADSNVLSITNLAPDHTTVNSFDKYTYDALGNALTDTNQDGQWLYTYDADSQLVQAVFTPNSSDPDGLAAQNIQYSYDAVGNRTSETVNGVTTTYVVNNVNEYVSSTTAGVTTTYQYDLDGNLIAQTTDGSTTDYTFNELSQLTGISGPSLTTSYTYDALGNRVSQTVNGSTTNFQIDPVDGDVMAAFGGTGAYDNSDGLLAHYTYGLDLVSQVSVSGTAGYYDFGLTGNTIGITNAAGSYVDKYSYLPFGQTTASAAALPNLFTFEGQFGVTQEPGSLFSIGSRFYSTMSGQFLSQDPSGLAGGDTNLRLYSSNDPTTQIDPTGLATYQVSGAFWQWRKDGMIDYIMANQGTSYTKLAMTDNAYFHGQTAGPAGHNQDTFVFDDGSFLGQSMTGHDVNYYYQGVLARSRGNSLDVLLATVTAWRIGKNHALPTWKELATATVGWFEYPGLFPNGEGFFQNGPPPVSTDPEQTATTNNSVSNLSTIIYAGSSYTGEVALVNLSPSLPSITSATTSFTDAADPGYDIPSGDVVTTWQSEPGNAVAIYATVTFPDFGEYNVIVTVNGNEVVETLGQESTIAYQPPVLVFPVNFTIPAGGEYSGPVATFTQLGVNQGVNGYTATLLPNEDGSITGIVPGPDNSYTVYGTVNSANPNPNGSYSVVVDVSDNFQAIGALPWGTGFVTDGVTMTAAGQTQYSTSLIPIVTPVNSSSPVEQPLAIIDTTDPTITSASQVNVTLSSSDNEDEDLSVPLVTGITLTQLSDGVTQIVVNGVVSATQAGPAYSVPLNITLGNEPTLTTEVGVDDSASAYTVNPTTVAAIVGQPVRNVEVATLAGPEDGSYSATINWGDGDTSTGVITALGGGLYSVVGSKPHPYAAAGTDTITVTVNGPGTLPAPPALTTATVVSVNPPVITSNPIGQTVTAGQTASFTASASGAQTVQWQVSSNGGSTFSNIDGATSTTLTLTNVTADMTGYEYQAVFSNSGGGSATTSAAMLTVTTKPVIISNPTGQTVTAGQTATFTASVSGNPAPTVQWQVSTNSGSTFRDISGATSMTLTLSNVQVSENGYEYQAVFTNSAGTATTSDATLTVSAATSAPVITSGNAATFLAGQVGSFLVTATGSPTPTLTESGALPSGVTFANNGNGTANLGGTVAAGTTGTYHFTITADNGVGGDIAQDFTLTVNLPSPPPPPPPPPPSPPPQPAQQPQQPIVPVLLALFNEFLPLTETVNANGITITDSLFGAPLVETYDFSGNLVSVTLFGINIPTFLFSL